MHSCTRTITSLKHKTLERGVPGGLHLKLQIIQCFQKPPSLLCQIRWHDVILFLYLCFMKQTSESFRNTLLTKSRRDLDGAAESD